MFRTDRTRRLVVCATWCSPGTGGGFVCIEKVRGADHVEGNVVVDDHHHWLPVIVADSGDSADSADSADTDHTVETGAMVALLDAAPH